MPPKKRSAEENTDGTAAQPNELRRSTRGGGHPAPAPEQPKAKKPASSNGKSKKAKTTDDNGDDKTAATSKGAENGAKVDAESNGKADTIVQEAEKDAKKEGVEVPEENKEVANEKAGKRIEVGEQIPENIVLKVWYTLINSSFVTPDD